MFCLTLVVNSSTIYLCMMMTVHANTIFATFATICGGTIKMNENEMTPDIYTLVDEDGNEQAFELLDTLSVDQNRYFAFIPYFDNPEESLEDDGDLVILKSEIVDEEEMMTTIDDDEVYERVGAMFLERLNKMFDEDYSEEDDEEDDAEDEDE